MPLKIGGGNQLQEYDSENGRYTCESSEYSRAYERSLYLYENMKAKDNQRKTSKIMPNYRKSITPDTKFLEYCLNPEHIVGKHKAKVFKAIFGFEKDNFELLKQQIHNSIVNGTASLIKMSKNNYGTIEYNYAINVVGANGVTGVVVAKYGFNKKTSRPFMITSYVRR